MKQFLFLVLVACLVFAMAAAGQADSTGKPLIFKMKSEPISDGSYVDHQRPLSHKIEDLERRVDFLTRDCIETHRRLDSTIHEMQESQKLAQFNTNVDNIYIRKWDSLIDALREPIKFTPGTSVTNDGDFYSWGRNKGWTLSSGNSEVIVDNPAHASSGDAKFIEAPADWTCADPIPCFDYKLFMSPAGKYAVYWRGDPGFQLGYRPEYYQDSSVHFSDTWFLDSCSAKKMIARHWQQVLADRQTPDSKRVHDILYSETSLAQTTGDIADTIQICRPVSNTTSSNIWRKVDHHPYLAILYLLPDGTYLDSHKRPLKPWMKVWDQN